MIRLPEKRPAEEITVAFRFTRDLPDGVTLMPGATVSIAVRKGSDPDAAAMLAGVPAVSGSVVLQKVVAGLDRVQYQLTCLAETSTGDLLQLDGLLPVALPR